VSPQAVRFLIRDRRNKGWFRVSNDIWLMDIGRYAKLVYCYLCRCAEDISTCNPSFPDMRRKTGCSHGTIVKALQDLEKVGLIKRTPETGTSTTYEIFDPIVERTQSQVDRPLPSHELTAPQPLPSHRLTAPQSRVDQTTQSQVDRKEDLVLNKTKVKKTQQSQKQHPAPRNGAAKSAQAIQGLLPEVVGGVVEAGLEVPTPAARPAGPTHVAAAAPARRGHPAVVAYCDGWRVRYGRNPDISATDAGILARLAKKADLEEYRLARYLRDDDPFLVKLAHPPSQFEGRWNPLGVNGNGSRPASIREKWAGAKPGLVSL